MSHKDNVVIVTGSSSGIGAATAVLFAKEGAQVVVVGQNETKLKNVAEKCAKFGKLPFVIKINSVNEDPMDIVKKTVIKFGKINVLVNNVGCVSKYYYERNLLFSVGLKNAAKPFLKLTNGVIINISSSVENKPCTMIPYSFSEAEIIMYLLSDKVKGITGSYFAVENEINLKF